MSRSVVNVFVASPLITMHNSSLNVGTVPDPSSLHEVLPQLHIKVDNWITSPPYYTEVTLVSQRLKITS